MPYGWEAKLLLEPARAGYRSKFFNTNNDTFTSIPVPEWYFFRYLFYNINSNKKEITLHITVQIFSFIFQPSISISRREPPKGINKVTFHLAVFLQKSQHVCFLHVLNCSNIKITAGFRWTLIYLLKCPTLRRPRYSTQRSHQKRLVRPRRPAAIHFQCKLAPMSGRRCERHVVSFVSFMSVVSFESWERLNFMQMSSDATADLDTESGKGQSESKNHGGETYYCRNWCIDGLLNMPAIW